MDFFELVQKRKSVRKFESKAVPMSAIEKIMNAARLAPSWRNRQSWKFILVTDSALKKQLIQCTDSFNQAWLGGEFAIVVACGDPRRSGVRDGLPYFMVDAAIAMEHLVLAATELGLGACWISAFNEEKVKKLLEIPEHIRVVALSPLGYPAKKDSLAGAIARKVVKSKNRKPLNEVYTLNKWE
ncbi:nitroreductase [candidate division KSB1 bacterium 4484_87]|nr:MAG: nitroreductase [candidate division KSB1 bacterium 4484_87]